MKQITISEPGGYIVAIVYLSIVSISFLFAFINLCAASMHRETIFKYKPRLQIEKVRYYNDILSYISRASSLSPANANYYSDKANILRKAINEGLQNQLRIYAGDVEKYYIKAIELNPTNFSYHSDLSLWYIQQNKSEGKDMLLSAIELCPKCYLLYAELANYYLSKNHEDEAFFSILKMLWHYGQDSYKITRIMRDKYASGLKRIAFGAKPHELVRFSIYPKTASVDFDNIGLPPVRVPLRVQIYAKDIIEEAILYYKFTPYAFFAKKGKSKSGDIIYEAEIKEFPPGSTLREFRVEIDSSIIEELVFVVDILYYTYAGKK